MRRRFWTTEEDDLLQRWYGKVLQSEIAGRLGRTVPSVVGRAGLLGLRPRKSPRWSRDDLDFLLSNYGRLTEAQIAKKLRRTTVAVDIKAKRLKLGRCRPPGSFSAQGVSEVLGIDIHSVRRWIRLGWLKAERRVTKGKPVLTAIMIDDLERFLQAYPEAWDSRRASGLWKALCAKRRERDTAKGKTSTPEKRRMLSRIWEELTRGSVAAELAGPIVRAISRSEPEPEWLKTKRLADQRLPARRFEKWTPQEDARLRHLLLGTGLTYREIGKRLGRSEAAISHRTNRVRVLAASLARRGTAS